MCPLRLPRSQARWLPGPEWPTTSFPTAQTAFSGRPSPPAGTASPSQGARTRTSAPTRHCSWGHGHGHRGQATRRGSRWEMLWRCGRAGSGRLQRRSGGGSAGAGSRPQAWSCSWTRESHWWGSWHSRAARCRCEGSSIGQDAIARSAKAHGIQSMAACARGAQTRAEAVWLCEAASPGRRSTYT
jgi:hypothetical protein